MLSTTTSISPFNKPSSGGLAAGHRSLPLTPLLLSVAPSSCCRRAQEAAGNPAMSLSARQGPGFQNGSRQTQVTFE